MSATQTHDATALIPEWHVADQLGMTPAALSRARRRGVGPPYVRIGRRIRYRARDVADYIAANTVTPGSVASQQD